LLSDLSAAFIRAPAAEIDTEIARWLQRIALEVGIDKAFVGQVKDGKLTATHQWVRERVTPNVLSSAAEGLPWLAAKILAGEIIVLDDVKDAPQQPWPDLQQALAHGSKAVVSVPLRIGGEIAGAVVFTSLRERKWPAQMVHQLKRVTEIFGIALERQQSIAVIRRLREEVQEVLRIISMAEVTASLAHELNQPLGAILNNAQAARRLLNGKTPNLEDSNEAIEEIIRDVARATDTIRHTREIFQSLAEGKSLVDLKQLLLDVAHMLRNAARDRGVAVRLNVSAILPPITVNRQGMIQVLMNLILNAFDSIAECADGPREVEISTEQTSEDVHVRIRDSGKGIDSEILPKLFNAFFTTKPKGTGMGLAIARSILEKNGGRIWAKQNQGRGAIIEFTLPLGVAASRL
jgi:signal transduction histidine kinase